VEVVAPAGREPPQDAAMVTPMGYNEAHPPLGVGFSYWGKTNDVTPYTVRTYGDGGAPRLT